MADFYAEQLVKRKVRATDLMIKWGLIILTVLAVVMALMTFSFIFFIAAVILGFLCFWLVPKTEVEFEYLYVNGELDIDKIFSRSRRKRAARYDLSKLEVAAPVTSHHLDSYRNDKNIKTVDFSSGMAGQAAFALILNTDRERQRILVELEERIVKDMRSKYPRKVFFD